MCFDHDSRPPIPPIAGGAVAGARSSVRSTDDTELAVFVAAAEPPTGAGMLVLPDVRGLHPYYEELALRFAEAGVDAIAIDYFGRTAGLTPRGPEFDHGPHVAQLRYDALIGDVVAAAAQLRSRSKVRALFSVGFCFGGRLSFICAARPELQLAGAIGFYGWPVGQSRGGVPAPAELASRMRAPVLGLFGGSDEGIPASAVAEFERALSAANTEHELVTFAGAPHSFFDRKAADYEAQSAEAWQRLLDFVRRNTPPA